jgi:nifR3 family TIM-barrel protein
VQIGDFKPATNLLLAPMAGYCDLSFRLVVRSIGGVGLACTQLLHPDGLLRRTRRSTELAATCLEDRPLCVQLVGGDPALMAAGARYATDCGAAVIDINMGCPADKITQRHGGVALMRGLPLATRIAWAVVKAVSVPVTVKLRLGCDDSDLTAPRLARMLEDVGVQAVTVHGRTGAQRFGGTVDLDGIAAVVEAVRDIPIIGNGDVRSPQDAKHTIDRTGCAGVMIGRRALADPWIFRDAHAYLTTGRVPPPPSVADRVAAIVQHFENLRRYRSDRAACVVFRQRISWYARLLPQARKLKQRMNSLDTPQEFRTIIAEYLESSSKPSPQSPACPAALPGSACPRLAPPDRAPGWHS